MYSSRRVGVVYVALGENALVEANESIRTVRKNWSAKGDIYILTKPLHSSPAGASVGQQAHWAKTCADLWSPFDFTLLLDADTRVKASLSVGFTALKQGWDLVMVPSESRGVDQWRWRSSSAEWEATLIGVGLSRPLMLNTGVLFFAKTPRTQKFFKAWRSEWLRFRGLDQGAFLRASGQVPVAIWLLGLPFNSAGGEVVDHLFGRAR
jgi:hypothetical protein